jgi:nucleotide-binding universal stress UspA family protein
MNFDHILFPIDFSNQCSGLKNQVEWLAGRFGSRVTLLHVFEIPASWYGSSEAMFVNSDCFEPIKDEAKRRLREYSINVPEERVERFVGEGDATAHITQWASESDVDLIVMGTHGYGKFRGLLLGSVTAKVLHDVSCPVWTNALVNPKEDNPVAGFSNIVCALELTDEAVPLLHFTQELAQELVAKVHIVHSVPKMEARPDKYFDFDLHRYLTESARVEISKRQREAGTDFPITISDGRIATGVADVARDEGADLIVVGRGKCQEPFGRLRTHTYGIIREAPCPVLSYAVGQRVRISSSCSEARLGQYATDGRLLTGSLTS